MSTTTHHAAATSRASASALPCSSCAAALVRPAATYERIWVLTCAALRAYEVIMESLSCSTRLK